MKNYIGNCQYWPLLGYDLELPQNVESRNFIKYVKEMFLPNDISDIVYIEKYERVFFTRIGFNNVVYSQYFPGRIKDDLKAKLAKEVADNNEYSAHKLDEIIVKLAASKESLYALLKSNESYSLVKIATSENGIKKNEVKAKVSLPPLHQELKPTNVEMKVIEHNENEANIYLLLQEKQTIFCGKYKMDSKDCNINQKLKTNKGKKYVVTSFSISNNIMAIYERQNKSLIIMEYDKHTETFNFIRKENITENIDGIKLFSIKLNSIVDEHLLLTLNKVKNLPENNSIRLVILYNKTKMWYYNIEKRIISPLIRGDVPIVSQIRLEPKERVVSNISDFKCEFLSDVYVFDNNCLVFSEKYNPQILYFFLLKKLKETWDGQYPLGTLNNYQKDFNTFGES